MSARRRVSASGAHRRAPRRLSGIACAVLLAVVAISMMMACVDKTTPRRQAGAFQGTAEFPDELPVVLNTDLPFRYPAPLYERRVQGNVTLRLYLDRDGSVTTDSIRVEESSGYPALDSAAIKGSAALRFVPAKLRGDPVPATVLFPVYFRHPEARALPGDTILNKHGIVK